MDKAHAVERVKQLWAAWDIRIFMLISLLIQALLTCLAPWRKRCAAGFFVFTMWLMYLFADAVALYTIGLISSGQGDSLKKTELVAFWAPFLLLHLGGPDTITALALEDNELWHRHALQLVTQVGVTVYVFIQSFRHNDLLWPTLLMFFNGCVKYIERICALYFASADVFRESVAIQPESGPSYAWLMEEYYAAKNAHIPTTLQRKIDAADKADSQGAADDDDDVPNDMGELADEEIVESKSAPGDTENDAVGREEDERVIISAHKFYTMFKGVLADAFLNFEDRKESRDFFLNESDLQAFRIIQVELNLVYDVFYTKAFLLHRRRAYLRCLTVLSVVISLLVFTLKDKRNYQGIDLIITFSLLGGALVLDVCAGVMFILSDWWIIIMSADGKSSIIQSLFARLLKWSTWVRQPHSGRWSQSVSQYNLLKRCLRDPPSIAKKFFVKRIRDALIGLLYAESEQVDDKLVKLIVGELKMKARLVSEDSNAMKEVCSARGNLVLQDDYGLISEYLYPWTMGMDYDESLLTWHIATDICYLTAKEHHQADYCRLSKILSDYMAYLVLMKQTMVSPVVGKSDMLFEDICAETKKFMKVKMQEYMSIGNNDSPMKFIFKKVFRSTSSRREQEFVQEFCKRVMEAYNRPMADEGDKSKYVLFNARHLAQQLNMIGDKQWEIMGKVWLELLCYAAIRCSPRSHVAQLSKGGELITLVWLLMTHLGLGECFLQNQGLRWTKLIIQK